MPWNVLLIPLIAGYYLLSKLNYYKFVSNRLDQQRLLFESALCGALLSLFAFIVRYLFQTYFTDCYDRLYQMHPFKGHLLGSSCITLILSFLIVQVFNRVYSKGKGVIRGIEYFNNEFEMLLVKALKNSTLVMVTLDTDKVYIGWVIEAPIPSESKYIKLLPVISGYRDGYKRLKYTTHYLSAYNNDSKDVEIDLVITISSVVTIATFDLSLYDELNN